MIAMMKIAKRQRGLSLFWCAILMAVLAAGAMLVLFSLRHERNPLAEIWSRASQAGAVAGVRQKMQGIAADAQPAAVRRCIVDGSVLYSNVDCDPKKSGSKAVRLHVTEGFEAPKVPPAAIAGERFEEEFLPQPSAMPARAR